MNEELQVRNLLLAEAQEYAEAILFTIRESLIVLDYDFRIKTVNHAFTTTFNLSEADVEGKLFHDINNKLWEIPALSSLLDDIVRHNKEFRDFEVTAKIGNNTKKLVLNAKRLIQNTYRQQLILIAIEDLTGLQGKS
jgi:two-component system CheB/CheR fusion protein